MNILWNFEIPSTVFDNISRNMEIQIPNNWFNLNLNGIQKETILHCLKSRDISLIHGPPGTGKTTTIVELILQHARLYPHSKILCCAPSNTAVDNITEKLINSKKMIPMVRVGHPARMMESVHCRCLDSLMMQSFEEYCDSYFNNTTDVTPETKEKFQRTMLDNENKTGYQKGYKKEQNEVIYFRTKEEVRALTHNLGVE